MACKRAFQLEGLRGLVLWLLLPWNGDHGFEVFDFPDLGRVVGGAGCEVLDIRREKDAGYIVFVRGEVGYRNEGGLFAVLEEVPDVDIALSYVRYVK
jgi:hypothetical protein